VAIIIPANSAADTAFSVANSCRFNDDDGAYMHKTVGAPTNGKIFTFSFWFKLGSATTSQYIISSCTAGSPVAYTSIVVMQTATHNNVMRIECGSVEGNAIDLKTNQSFRDPSAWMHVCVAIDTSQSTAANRDKLYINGTQVTSFATETHSTQDDTWDINADGNKFEISSYGCDTPGYYFDGYLAEVCFVDGQQLAPTSFGEFDEDSPTIWKPIDVSGLTFGNNGFYLDFEDSSNLGNDKNGGTDLTEVNLAAVDQATDTPTNNFCTMNPLDNFYYASTFSEGNLKITTNASNKTYNTSTFAVTAGKWYWECKASDTNSDDAQFGIASVLSTATDDELKTSAGNYCYRSPGTKATGDSSTSYGDTWNDDGDIISVALDLDNLKIYFAKNGTWQNSGDPESGGTGTGAAFTITAPTSQTLAGSIQAYTPAFGEEGAQSDVFEVNFGNPSYANSSDAADANGYGAFEYAPPSGYLALCTKNLGSDGG
jgi:hypothetical protein